MFLSLTLWVLLAEHSVYMHHHMAFCFPFTQ